MPRRVPNAVDYLEAGDGSLRREPREYVPKQFPPAVEARIRKKIQAGLSRRIAEEVVERELNEEGGSK